MSDDLSGDMLAPSWPNLVVFQSLKVKVIESTCLVVKHNNSVQTGFQLLQVTSKVVYSVSQVKFIYGNSSLHQ